MLKKITSGFVVQVFDPELKRFVSQSFVAGEADYEDEDGVPVDCDEFADEDGKEAYCPFNMVQPDIGDAHAPKK